jgi:hypothetical protein
MDIDWQAERMEAWSGGVELSDLSILRALKKPPRAIYILTRAVLTLLEPDLLRPDWPQCCHRLFAGDTLARLPAELDRYNIAVAPETVIKRFHKCGSCSVATRAFVVSYYDTLACFLLT